MRRSILRGTFPSSSSATCVMATLPLAAIFWLLAITAVLAVAFARTGNAVASIAAHGTFDAVQLFIFLPAALKFLKGG